MAVLNDSILLDFVNSFSPKSDYVDIAQEHINYCFGKNANAMSFVTGYGTAYPKNPHHRPSQKVGAAIPGMIIGGVNSGLEDPYAKVYLEGVAPAKCYLDNSQCYSINEADIYWNSTLVNALAKTGMVGTATTPEVPDVPEIPDVSQGAEKLAVNLKTTKGNEIRQEYSITAKDSSVDL